MTRHAQINFWKMQSERFCTTIVLIVYKRTRHDFDGKNEHSHWRRAVEYDDSIKNMFLLKKSEYSLVAFRAKYMATMHTYFLFFFATKQL